MYVRKKLGGRNFMNKEKAEIEENQNVQQQDKQDNILPENINTPAEANNLNIEHKHQEPEKIEGGKKKQIRCKKWPQCKSENCDFGHPTETVIISKFN
jgi:hypothetical protein